MKAEPARPSLQRPSQRRIGLAGTAAIVAAVLVMLSATPARALLCAEIGTGDVVFVGTVVDVPSGSELFPSSGVYRFAVQDLLVGDPGDGRIYNPPPYGGAGFAFRLGETYRVHARAMTEGEFGFADLPAGVTLTADGCLATSEVPMSPASMVRGIGAWVGHFAPHIAVVISAVAAAFLVIRGMRARKQQPSSA